jgi:hypothetical protein
VHFFVGKTGIPFNFTFVATWQTGPPLMLKQGKCESRSVHNFYKRAHDRPPIQIVALEFQGPPRVPRSYPTGIPPRQRGCSLRHSHTPHWASGPVPTLTKSIVTVPLDPPPVGHHRDACSWGNSMHNQIQDVGAPKKNVGAPRSLFTSSGAKTGIPSKFSEIRQARTGSPCAFEERDSLMVLHVHVEPCTEVGRVCYTRGYFQGRGSPHSPLVELFNKLNSILVTL